MDCKQGTRRFDANRADRITKQGSKRLNHGTRGRCRQRARRSGTNERVWIGEWRSRCRRLQTLRLRKNLIALVILRNGTAGSFVTLDEFSEPLHIAHERRKLPSLGEGFGRVAPMLEGVSVRAIFRRASGSARSSSRAIGTASRPSSGLGNAGSSAWASCFAWGCSSGFERAPPPGVPTTPTTACPPAWTWTCSTVTFCWPLPRWRLRASRRAA
jgi:hypothetical protein